MYRTSNTRYAQAYQRHTPSIRYGFDMYPEIMQIRSNAGHLWTFSRASAILAEQRQEIEDVGDIGISIAVDISAVIDSK